ncbi:hypothetical protein E2C01_020349 [Portunus trituberculatus]|uniref:Uncharacterized protein n=1 Tax=Portunus trituberculatus TaxID=210409 RepID=A0A5B7E1S0_PORTR|nr:hypothetical protein [Portunus trituberculatus]
MALRMANQAIGECSMTFAQCAGPSRSGPTIQNVRLCQLPSLVLITITEEEGMRLASSDDHLRGGLTHPLMLASRFRSLSPSHLNMIMTMNTGKNIVGSASLSSPLTRNSAALWSSSSVPASHWTAVPKLPAPITLPLSPVADTRPPGGALQGLSCGHSASGERVMGQARNSDTLFHHLCPLMFLRWIQTYRHNPSCSLNKRLDTQLPPSFLEVTYEGFHPCPTLCLASTLGRSPLHHYSSYDVLLLLQVSQSCICLHKRIWIIL